MPTTAQTLIPIDMGNIQKVPPADLRLDPRNPRLTGRDFTVQDQIDILRFLWQDKEVSELVDSISSNGYWPQEVLFATKEGGHLIVVEGNRRLAAVKLLMFPSLCRQIGARGVPTDLSPRIISTYSKLPVIECRRVDLWMYMGFKHVNGPQEWDSIAKAEYIADVHDRFNVSLSRIASTIGDRHDTVKRLYHGLEVLHQAERAGVFRKENAWGKRFPYSHLWTALGYASVQRFLGITQEAKEKPNPVPRRNIPRLGDFCLWLFGSKDPERRPLIKSQNPDLRRLSEIVASEKGIAALSRIGDAEELSDIWRFSRWAETMLRESLVAAEKALREACGYLPTGYAGESGGLLEQGKTIRELAEAIWTRMEEAHKNRCSRT